ALAEAMAGFQQAGNLHFAISVTSGLADIRIAQGRLREAINIYAQALQLALAQGEPLLRGTADLYVGLSELYREQGDLEAARGHLLRSDELGEQAALPDWRFRLCCAQARFKEAQGDFVAALNLLDEAERHYYRTPLPDLRPLAALKARVWLAQGRLREALGWAHEQGLSVDDELSFLHEFDHITLTRVLIAEYRRDRTDRAIHEATRLLERLEQAAEAGGRVGSAIEIGILHALAHHAQGSLAPALVALEHALRLAEPEGYVRIFIDEGPAMATLLAQSAERRAPNDSIRHYVERLLAAFPEAQSVERGAQNEETAALRSTLQRPSALVEPLSARELEVLQLIAQGFSNGQIGARLFLALSTIK